MRRRPAPWTLPLLLHQGGWDEAILVFGVPFLLFVFMRWLAGRREAREKDGGSDG